MVEDVDGEIVLFHDSFVLCQRYAEDEHKLHADRPSQLRTFQSAA